MTQSAFARLIGISEGFLSMILHGQRRLGVDRAKKLASKFGIPLEEFFK